FAVSPSSTILASCGNTREIKLFDTANWQSRSLYDNRKGVGSWHLLAFTPDDRYLTFGGGWGGQPKVHFWELSSGQETSPLKYDNPGYLSVLSMAFSPDCKTLATGLLEPGLLEQSKYQVILWNWTTGKILGKIPFDYGGHI